MASIADELQKLQRLYENGGISEAEYAKAKESLLHPKPGINVDTKQWGMFIHLSQLGNMVFPPAGYVLPIVLWQMKKNEGDIDEHGKVVANWMISSFIYLIVSALLCVVVVGIPMVIVLLILGIVFPIVGAIKSSSGEVWQYPMSIKFFPPNPTEVMSLTPASDSPFE